MPWKRYGKCVYRLNADGSKGKLEGCSETVEMAKNYLKTLYANAGEEASRSRPSQSKTTS